MSHFGSTTEYGLHTLLLLNAAPAPAVSIRDLADFQQLPRAFLAKIVAKLEKAGLVVASEGLRGGYRLARSRAAISMLDAVDALEGDKPLFACRDIRGRCALFDGDPPDWATRGTCAIHAVMLKAERSMRDELRRTAIDDVATALASKAPAGFADAFADWQSARAVAQEASRQDAIRAGVGRRRAGMVAAAGQGPDDVAAARR